MKKKKILIIIALLILGGVFVFSLYNLHKWNADNKNTQKTILKLDKETVIDEIESEEELETPLYTVNIEKLKESNKDTVAYIILNGTKVSYPIVQTSDNDYYLNHSFDKTQNDAGWIFMDYRNKLADYNLVIYGHSRKDKTMFGSLHSLLKKSWFDNPDNKYINFISENSSSIYQIFSVYTVDKADNNHIMVEFRNNFLYKQFLEEITTKSLFSLNKAVNEDDKIITLSTCKNDKSLIVIHGVLLHEE